MFEALCVRGNKLLVIFQALELFEFRQGNCPRCRQNVDATSDMCKSCEHSFTDNEKKLLKIEGELFHQNKMRVAKLWLCIFSVGLITWIILW